MFDTAKHEITSQETLDVSSCGKALHFKHCLLQAVYMLTGRDMHRNLGYPSIESLTGKAYRQHMNIIYQMKEKKELFFCGTFSFGVPVHHWGDSNRLKIQWCTNFPVSHI